MGYRNEGGHPVWRKSLAFPIGVTQLKALKVERNSPTPPFSPLPTALWAVGRGEKNPLGAERGAFGAPLRPQSPHGKRTGKS